LLFYFAGFIAIAAWFFTAWGAYRELNRSSRFCSALAAILFVAFSIPVTVFFFFLANFGASVGPCV